MRYSSNYGENVPSMEVTHLCLNTDNTITATRNNILSLKIIVLWNFYYKQVAITVMATETPSEPTVLLFHYTY